MSQKSKQDPNSTSGILNVFAVSDVIFLPNCHFLHKKTDSSFLFLWTIFIFNEMRRKENNRLCFIHLS